MLHLDAVKHKNRQPLRKSAENLQQSPSRLRTRSQAIEVSNRRAQEGPCFIPQDQGLRDQPELNR